MLIGLCLIWRPYAPERSFKSILRKVGQKVIILQDVIDHLPTYVLLIVLISRDFIEQDKWIIKRFTERVESRVFVVQKSLRYSGGSGLGECLTIPSARLETSCTISKGLFIRFMLSSACSRSLLACQTKHLGIVVIIIILTR